MPPPLGVPAGAISPRRPRRYANDCTILSIEYAFVEFTLDDLV